MRKINFLFAFLLSMMGATQAWADETLSLTYGADDMVSEHYGTYIPFRGYNADDNFQKSEFILSATELASMNGKLITKMQFQTYESTSSINPTIKFYLQEVSSNEVSTSFTGIETATKVYEGSISVSSDKHMTIAFNEPYLYNGGNLLVTCHLTAKSTVTGAHINFIGGPTSTNAAVFGMSSYSLSYLTSGTINQFLPNITFTYETPAVVNQVMLPGEFNGWQGTQNELVYDEASKSYKGVLDLSNTTDNQKFKLLVKAEGVADDIWLGWPEKTAGKLTIDAPEGWVYDYSNDNLYLMNSTTDFKTYNITATWRASEDASTGWTLKIEGKDDRRNTYTATFTNNAAWSEVYAYAWSGDGDAAVKFLGNYPGTKLTEKNGNVYTLTFKARQQPEHILFSDGTDANKTSDLTFTNGGEYNNGELHTYTATMTFTNDAWDKVYAYAFTGDGDAAKKYLGAWPGTELTAENGVYTVTIEATEAPAYIIFTDNNGQQTDDLVFVDGNAYEVYYKVPGIDLYWTTSTFSLPDEWTYDSESGWAGYGYATAKGGNMVYAANYWQEHNTNTTSIVTNLVGVSDTNDLLTISAYRWSYASTGETILNVYKSKDKENWELVKAFNESEIGSSLTELQVSGVEAGNYYFKFEINNVAFDYFYGFSLAKPMTLALDEAATENQVVAGTYDEVTVAFTMQAGKFAAICLPFATTTTALGEGVKAWAFTSYTDGNIDLSTTTDLAAATPYIVYAENGIDGLTFQNVTIESNEAGKVVQGAATFQGSYVKMAAGTMTGKYGVTPAGKIQKAGLGASMKAFRAYFEGITQNAKLVCDGMIIGEATGIDTIENAAQTGELYDLQGRRVMNAQKGLYIQNGKKFVVK